MAKRLLLTLVVTSRLLYAASVWADRVINYAVNIHNMSRPLRLAAIRAIRCYRTVSTALALVLAGLPPGDLLALERLSMHRHRKDDPSRLLAAFVKELREATIAEWQLRWTAESQVVGWTRRVVPSVTRWVNRPPGAPVTFHLAQAMTSHGAFNEYLYRIGIIASPQCAHYRPPTTMWTTPCLCAPNGATSGRPSLPCLTDSLAWVTSMQ